MTQRHPMTVQGAEQVKKELHQLKNIERPRITEAIALARSYGDLKENAEYHAAREMQSFNEARIRDLEEKIAHAQVVDIANLLNDGKVIFGSKVRLRHLDSSGGECSRWLDEL